MLAARTVGQLIDAVVTVTDDELYRWLRRLWHGAGLRLEPSAAAGFAAASRFAPDRGQRGCPTHVVWTTGGAHLPEAEFQAALARSGPAEGATPRESAFRDPRTTEHAPVY
jgi:D-serine dehydratase